PHGAESLEALEGVAREAIAAGGTAYICVSRFVEASTDKTLLERFVRERNADYASIEKSLRVAAGTKAQALLKRARERFDQVSKIDFFEAPNRPRVEALIESASKRLEGSSDRLSGSLAGKTWVTRPGVHIDRIASAWLVHRFVDPDASFRF